MSRLKEAILMNLFLPLGELFQGTCAMKWYKRINLMNRWERAAIEGWQDEQLRLFVRHAYEHTSYYRKLFDRIGITPDDIQSRHDLKKVPIITKEIVNANYEDLIPDDLSSFKYRLSRSGGTTGIPMQYYCDENVWGYVTAAKMYHWKKTGYRYGDPFIALGSASLFSQKPSLPRRIYDRLRNEHPLNCVNLTDDICAEYCEYIDAHHIRYIYGYAAAIYMFAVYVKEHRIDIKGICGVFTTSENLTDNYRTAIEEAFHCKVMDCYGARDAGITAYEIHPHCYNIGYNTIVEIENEIDENVGSVVCTNFLNYCFPLIRYQFGDEAEICPENEVRDYNGQQFIRILGRTSHVLRLENNHKLTATGISMIMKEFDVAAFDIQKTGTNEVLLRLQIIPGKYTEEQEALIIKTLKKYLGDDCALTVEKVPKFEPNKNGKRTYFMV